MKSSKFLTLVTRNKSSVWYMKRRTSNNKRVSKLIVQTAGNRKGNYVFSLFNHNGSRNIIRYNAKKQIRFVSYQENKNTTERLLYVLHKVSGKFDNNWVKESPNDTFNKLMLKV